MDDTIEPRMTSPVIEATNHDLIASTDEQTTLSTAVPQSLTSDKLQQHSARNSLEGNMRIAGQDSGYNSSGSSGRLSPTEVRSGGASGGELARTRSRASSHSSISSLPDSTLANIPDVPKSSTAHDSQDYTLQQLDHPSPRAVHTLRQRDTSFRRPSSVRAMQMHTEDEGDDYFHLTPPRRRGSGRTSDISIRSAGSSPFKRSPYYSPTGAAAKPKVKKEKEYPLVLLHCTLLSPSLPVSGLIGHPDRQKILKEVLPPVYWKRWKLLEDKIGSGVLRDRGVLISHPEDLYDLLEERLLESLELQHPRLDHGHFVGRDESDFEREHSARDESSTEDDGDECPDCGGRFVKHNTTRKWEIKVFAANGLMRAGAWAAAWKEMEKVDVEVGLWLPNDVRASLERRLADDSSDKPESRPAVSLLQDPENIPVGTPVPALPLSSPSIAEFQPQAHFIQPQERSPSPFVPEVTPPQSDNKGNTYVPKPSEEIDLQTLLVNYIRVLASDPRNIAIVFLSVLVAYVAINHHQVTPTSELRPFPRFTPDYSTSVAVALQEPATQTWAEDSISQTLSPAVSDSEAVLPSIAPCETPSSVYDVSDVPVEPSLVEPEEVLPAESGTSLVESVESVFEKAEEGEKRQEQPADATEDKLEEPLSTALEIKAAEDTATNVDEEQQPAQATEDEQNESLPTAEDAPSTERVKFDTESEEQANKLSGDKLEELPSLETETQPIDAVEQSSEAREKTVQSGNDEPQLPLETTMETPSVNDNVVIMSEEEDPSDASETTSPYNVAEDQETLSESSQTELELPLETATEASSTASNEDTPENIDQLGASETTTFDGVEDALESQENSSEPSEDELDLSLPTLTETSSAESTHIQTEERSPVEASETTLPADGVEDASGNQEHSVESSKDDLESALEAPTKIPVTDSSEITPEEEAPLEVSETADAFKVAEDVSAVQDISTASGENELHSPSKTPTEMSAPNRIAPEEEDLLETSETALAFDVAEDAPGNRENPTASREDELQSPSGTPTQIPVTDSNDIAPEEEGLLEASKPVFSFDTVEYFSTGQENPTEPSDGEITLPLESQIQTPLADSNDITPDEEDASHASEIPPLDEPLSTSAPIGDADNEQALTSIAQDDNNGPTNQDQQNDQHESSELNDQNDENEI